MGPFLLERTVLRAARRLPGEEGRPHQPQPPLLPALLHLLDVAGEQRLQRGHQLGQCGEVPEAHLEGSTGDEGPPQRGWLGQSCAGRHELRTGHDPFPASPAVRPQLERERGQGDKRGHVLPQLARAARGRASAILGFRPWHQAPHKLSPCQGQAWHSTPRGEDTHLRLWWWERAETQRRSDFQHPDAGHDGGGQTSSHPVAPTVPGVPASGPPMRPTPHAHLHVVEGNANSLVEVRAEEGDLGIALAEVVQHDERGVHPHPHADGLGGSAANRA